METLLAGIDMKRSLWRSLQTHDRGEAGQGAGATLDFEALIGRAKRQRTELRNYHADAIAAAFDPLRGDQRKVDGGNPVHAENNMDASEVSGLGAEGPLLAGDGSNPDTPERVGHPENPFGGGLPMANAETDRAANHPSTS